ncbi:peptide/nickel transport system permease protein [Mesorhizobium soli]|uniref:ABC transporter permease n=1 Tax=Pseudaminobacter soli (ex Li et al. 2025) TaxID=1295366 RepID=UPI002473EB75|nr:ABC transporter permease [Mesorhizobium soli]MDH6234021.1 peptide/nickel transport system permease protein [Mesorhizobium soli]
MDILRRIWRSPSGRIGLIATLLVIIGGLAAPLLATHMPNQIDVAARLSPPSATHWLGTDQLGRDLFSRGLYGTRVAVGVALAVTAIALLIGILLGIAAAYAPAPIERIILAVFDIISAYPSLILALALVAVLGPGLQNIIILVTIVFVPRFGRIARAQTLTIKEQPFLEAERALGASGGRIMLFHVLPNIVGPIVVLASMNIPVVITLEAGLSFLGVGIRPPLASWGSMLFDGFTYIGQSVWPVLVAGGMLTLATLGFTLFGEALRDAIDPKLRREP